MPVSPALPPGLALFSAATVGGRQRRRPPSGVPVPATTCSRPPAAEPGDAFGGCCRSARPTRRPGRPPAQDRVAPLIAAPGAGCAQGATRKTGRVGGRALSRSLKRHMPGREGVSVGFVAKTVRGIHTRTRAPRPSP